MVNTKGNSQSEPKIVNEIKETVDNKNGFNVGRILTGLVFVLIGILALADNLGWLNVNWENLWYFWPIIIIAVGLSIISINGLIWKVAITIFGIATLLAMSWFMTFGSPNFAQPVAIETVLNKDSEDVQKFDFNIDTGASDINVTSFSDEVLGKVIFKSNLLKLSDSSSFDKGVQKISLSTYSKNGHSWIFGDIKNSWDVYLNRDLPLDLSIDAGASSIDLDLEHVRLNNLKINTGASNLDIRIGSLEKNINLDIDAGVSSIVIKVPSDSGIEVNIEGGLNSKSMLDLQKISDSLYRSSDYDKSENKIVISSNIGVSSFTLERY